MSPLYNPPTGGTELGYAENAADFSTASLTYVDVTSLSVTVTVGLRPIKVIIDSNLWFNGAGTATFQLVEDPAGAATAIPLGVKTEPTLSFDAFRREKRRTPSAGSHTYKLQMKVTAGTAHFDGSSASGAPNFIQVIEL